MHLLKGANFERVDFGLEEVAKTNSKANLIVVGKRSVVNRSVSDVLFSEAIVGTSNEGELNVAVVANVARDASAKERIECLVTKFNRVEVVGNRNEIGDIFRIVEVEVSSEFRTDRDVVSDGEFAVDNEAVVAAADADVVVARGFLSECTGRKGEKGSGSKTKGSPNTREFHGIILKKWWE